MLAANNHTPHHTHRKPNKRNRYDDNRTTHQHPPIRDNTGSHHELSPPDEWHGRTFPPPIESRHYGARITEPMDYYSTRCTFRSSFRSQRETRQVGCQDIWYDTQTSNRRSVKQTQSTAVRSSTKLATVPQQPADKVKLPSKGKAYVVPHSRAPTVSRANGNGCGLRTYSCIPLHLRGKTPGAADAVNDSNTRNRSNIANRDKISTDATVRKTRVVRTIQTPARVVRWSTP